MRLSLKLIAERMKLDPGDYVLSTKGEKRYSKVLLYSCGQEHPEENVLYAANQVPESRDRVTANGKQVGFLFLNLGEMDELASDCEYLYVKKPVIFSEMFNRVTGIVFEIQQQLSRLKDLVFRKAGLQKLIEELYGIFGNPAYLVDFSFKALAVDRQNQMRELSVKWRRLEDHGYLSLDLIADLMRSNELRDMEAVMSANLVNSNYFYTPFINYNLRYNGGIQGHLFIVGMFHKITPGDIELAEDVGEIVLQAMLNDEQFQQKRGYIYEHFIKDLFAGSLKEPAYIRQQIPYLNLKRGLFVMGKIVPEQTDELFLDRIVSQLERTTDVRAARYDSHVMGLFTVPDIEAVSELLEKLERLGRSLTCRVGVSDYFRNIYDTPIYAAQTSKALEMPEKSGRYKTIYHYPDIALTALLDMEENKKRMFFDPEILEIRLYDQQHETQYMDTLHVYLMCERGAMETAQTLNIHRNTLTYRIERMKELFHLHLDSAVHRLRYLLSLEMLALSDNMNKSITV